MLRSSIILATSDQLRDLLDDVVAKRFQLFTEVFERGTNRPVVSEYLSAKETLEYLHISKPTLAKLRRDGRVLTYYSSDKRLLFRRTELDKHLLTRSKKPP